tara:strand:- start:1160 stop:1462 length:303 start_codon:yes stop_codon:yes gene_type:complete
LKNLKIISTLIAIPAVIYFDLNLFIIMAAYSLSLYFIYSIGNKIHNESVYISYNWSAKWVLFFVFLIVTISNFPKVYFYAMTFFIVTNLFFKPTSKMVTA